ncbi:PfkB family carbohydrate kinase [Pengzhenrongella frigida]|uniref:Kinase n=1 Tax=Pengzhenrongella frigida TaxID=1259133 RepID=A0A4Q5N0N5_9MICO|nr:PfkB family carbohydrate kinase [Cellulomonas sp. HLT2-17]RYV51609.1 kinase [Cellulomonas sp. HLT2-17]
MDLGVFVGLATLDVVHRVERLPGTNEKVTALRQDVAAGGPAANAAVVFAALGGHARLVTALGTDPVARLIRAELEARGVEVIDVTPTATTPPAVSAVAVTDSTGDRSVTSRDGAAHDVAAPADLARHLAGAQVVLLDGHHPHLAAAAARAARPADPAAERAVVVLDAGRWRPVMAHLLDLVDVAVCSADFRAPGTTDSDASAVALLERGAGCVATTHGADPVQWWRPASSGRAVSGTVPVPRVTAVDTLGAGDAFHGAFAWFVVQRPLDHDGAGMRRALDSAARVAALRCTIPGPRDWLAALASWPTAAGSLPGTAPGTSSATRSATGAR